MGLSIVKVAMQNDSEANQILIDSFKKEDRSLAHKIQNEKMSYLLK